QLVEELATLVATWTTKWLGRVKLIKTVVYRPSADGARVAEAGRQSAQILELGYALLLDVCTLYCRD
ncbi:MAG: hypothetical protein AAF550_15040, partial [Myxococcota bacterium]